jgi:hypothetical protein
MEPYLISSAMVAVVCFFIGYHTGSKHTVINHTNNYTGEIDKIIINGEVRWIAPQKSAEANPPQPTTAPCCEGEAPHAENGTSA